MPAATDTAVTYGTQRTELSVACTNAALVHEWLERVAASPRFRGTSRLSTFLRYVVEKKLAGEAAEIKEYTIAVEVYKRAPDYDSRVDSIVRVEAGRLRSRLQKYYEAEGHADPVRFVIPRGTYVPEFVKVAEPVRATLPRMWFLVGAAAFLLSAAAAFSVL